MLTKWTPLGTESWFIKLGNRMEVWWRIPPNGDQINGQ